MSNITSGADFANQASDLTDEEIQKAFNVVVSAQRKYSDKPNSEAWLEKLRDEVLHRMAEIGILASFDPTPCFYGDPPEFEILGKVSGDPYHKYGLDHEKKKFEVQRATSRGEDYLGQKEAPNAAPAKKRNKS